MKLKHKYIIQQLANISFADRDEDTLSRIDTCVNFIQKFFNRSTKEFINYYWICVKKVYSKRYIQIEHAGSLQNSTVSELFKENPAWVGCKTSCQENSELIGGLKIKHGDFVIDRSIKGQLEVLMQTFKKL